MQITMFKTIKSEIEAEIIEKKSRFIAHLFHVDKVEEAENIIKLTKKKYHDARHNCYAYRIVENGDIIEKCSDDGEPSGTAGNPMLNILQKNEFANVLIIVTRYFGGVLLGTGGLVRAYSDSVSEALQKAIVICQEPGVEVSCRIKYEDLEKFKYYLKTNKINISKIEYNEDITVLIELNEEKEKKLIEDKENYKINIQEIKIVMKKNIEKE